MLFHQIFVTLTEGKRRFLRFTTYKSISNAIDYRAQHQMTKEIVRELHPDLFVTITSYDDMVRSKGYSYAHEHFENSMPIEKPVK